MLLISRCGPGLPKCGACAAPSKQRFEPFVYRDAIAVGKAVGFVGHADDRHHLAEHLAGHPLALRSAGVRGGAIGATVADAVPPLRYLLAQRVAPARRPSLL